MQKIFNKIQKYARDKQNQDKWKELAASIRKNNSKNIRHMQLK